MTSALDMPEIMSYIYSKSWKLQFSASSSIIIIEDYYLQTFIHSLIFIEPKGQHLIDNDIWKEHFLLQLEDDSKCIACPDYDNYSVKGLPFYTHNVKEQRFKEYFEKLYKHN